MPTENLTFIATIIGLILFGILVIGLSVSRLFVRASKETAFVRTGFGGQKVVVSGGSLVVPVLHEIIRVNMNTLRLEVRRGQESGLITKDRIRVDVQAEFFVRVKPIEEAIADAARRWVSERGGNPKMDHDTSARLTIKHGKRCF